MYLDVTRFRAIAIAYAIVLLINLVMCTIVHSCFFKYYSHNYYIFYLDTGIKQRQSLVTLIKHILNSLSLTSVIEVMIRVGVKYS